jgi:hypothetical protein
MTLATLNGWTVVVIGSKVYLVNPVTGHRVPAFGR